MDFQTIEAPEPRDIWDALRRCVQPGRVQEIPVEDSLDAVLASDARSAHDFPLFDRAVMDGYAVRSADLDGERTRLRDVGLVRAGADAVAPLGPLTCARINTGAPVPAGADAVVMVERTREIEDGLVELADKPQAGQFIDPRGSLIGSGDVVLRAGARIGHGALAALVAAGVKRVSVFAPPRVAQLSTGDELVAGGAELEPGQIYDSNSVVLTGLIRDAGGVTAAPEWCPDEPAALRAAIELGLSSDVLCVMGGMSRGTHDLVPQLLEELGVRWLVNGARLKPGKPMRIGLAPTGCWVMGLPGNPVSCAVCFVLFGRTIIDRLRGLTGAPPPHLSGRLEADMPAVGDRHMYQPAEWSAGDGGEVLVTPLVWRGSGDPFGLATANALIYRKDRALKSRRGEAVRFVPLSVPR